MTQSRGDRYKDFFEGSVLSALRRRRPGINWHIVDHAPGWNWAAFDRFRYNLWYGVGFTDPRREPRIRVNLHIGHQNREENQRLFQAISARREVVEHALGFPLDWEPPGQGTVAGSIAVYYQGAASIDDPPERLLDWSLWAVDMVVALRTVLTAHLEALV